MSIPGGDLMTGATSTLIGCAIIQAITTEAVVRLAQRGVEPPIFVSANVPEGGAHNDKLLKRYRANLARYQMPVSWD